MPAGGAGGGGEDEGDPSEDGEEEGRGEEEGSGELSGAPWARAGAREEKQAGGVKAEHGAG